MVTKICPACGEEKPIDRFPLGSQYNGGRSPICGHCRYERYQSPVPNAAPRPEQDWQPQSLSQAVIEQLERYKYEASHPAWGSRGKIKRR